MSETTRIEHDALGEFPVPADALYGIDTARAVQNFPISGQRMPLPIIRALALLKLGAARANRDLGLLDPALAEAIITAAREVVEGRWDDQFPVDIYQTGSGTSTNMNANEVIANRANELLGGGPRGVYRPVHPNDHVNRGQSSNDVIPTAIHLAAVQRIREHLLPALYRLEAVLQAKAAEFDGIVKTGRTHLMDAVPIRLGQEFRGYAGQVERTRRRVTAAGEALREVPLGGTAVGTGLNTHPEFAGRVLAAVSEIARVQLVETSNHFQAQAAIDPIVEASGHLRTCAIALVKVANDLRLMASGPRAGLGEIELPALQPGSSIMPGKVNPVIPEAVIQVAARVVGNDATIAMSGQWGFFELNTMLPVAGSALLESIELLGAAAGVFAEKCIAGIRATDRGPAMVEQGLAVATPLALEIGYERAAALVNIALAEGLTIREAARRELGLSERELDRLFDYRRMTGP
ncbi:class II fumarate hydratase [Tepidiforma sp.]|uniref:class II fumarate hydratase n=1 Tax=Tepidiforma sp. TaxID=2682230 RepID=UPI002ADE4F03|nr:class II fumarate hydratase [Tepidiforma sp.]